MLGEDSCVCICLDGSAREPDGWFPPSQDSQGNQG